MARLSSFLVSSLPHLCHGPSLVSAAAPSLPPLLHSHASSLSSPSLPSLPAPSLSSSSSSSSSSSFSSLHVCRASSSSSSSSSFASSSSAGKNRERLLQHLLVGEDQLAFLLDLQRQIQQGSDLSDLAVEHSICSSKNDGGMLGWVQMGQMIPEFEEAAFSAPLNKIVRVKTKFGWHLIQALAERESSFLKEIQPEELHSRLQDPTFLSESQFIDVREPDEISTAAIAGFKPYPLSQFSQWGPQISSELDIAKDTYVLCHHGVRSLQAAQWLKTQGFMRLYNVTGGIHQYSLKADRSIPTY